MQTSVFPALDRLKQKVQKVKIIHLGYMRPYLITEGKERVLGGAVFLQSGHFYKKSEHKI